MSVESEKFHVADALFVMVQFILLVLIALGPRGLGPEWPPSLKVGAMVTGAALMLAGALVCLAGAAQLGRNLTPSPRPRRDARLIRSGAYRLVRHPIYSGLILAAVGWALFVHGVLTLLYAVALFLLLDAKTRYEERMLVARFDDYRDYQRRVRRLVPFIY